MKMTIPVGTFARAFVALSLIASFAGCGGTTAKAPATLVSIAVTPATPSLAIGATAQLKAVGTYSDKTTKDLSSTTTWSSSATATASVAGGLVTGVAAGTATISATTGTIMGSTVVTVTAGTPPPPPTLVSIAVSPTNPSVAVGATQQFTAMGTLSNGTTMDVSGTVTWSSSTMATASISAAGLASGAAAGMTAITATSGAISGSTTLTVTATAATLLSIAVTPATMTIASGTTQQFMATGTYDDSSKKDLTATATWTSGTVATATVTTAGIATGLAGGTSVISAAVGAVSGTATLTVTVAALVSIDVTPGTPSIAAGTTQAFKATGNFKDPTTNAMTTQDLTATATWASVTVATATIAATGVATGKAMGTTMITATKGTIVGTATLTVTPAPLVSIAVSTPTPSIAKGTKATFSAIGTFMDGSTQDLTTQVTWASATPAVATITAAGVATGVAKNTSVISAKLGTIMNMATLTVTDATLVSIAVSIETPVAGAPAAIAKNTTGQLDAIGTYTDSSTQVLTTAVLWAATAGATISNATGSEGLVTGGNAAATSMITATVGTGATAVVGKLTLTIKNEVLSSILVKPATQQIAKGTSLQYAAVGFFTDASQQFVTETATWTSSDASVTISNAGGSKGLAQGKAVGTSMVKAAIGAINDIATLNVSVAVLGSISIDPPAPSLALGSSVNLTAEGLFSDKTKQDLTTAVSWSSGTPGTAMISNVAGTNGKVTTVAKGTTLITATFVVGPNQTVTQSVTLTVTDVALKSIEVSAATTTTIEKGSTLQFAARGTYTDGSTQDLTKTVTWKTDNTAVAAISNVAGTLGLATAAGVGMTAVTATSSVASGSIVSPPVTLTVNDGKLVSIALTASTPLNVPSFAVGTFVQITAKGTYDDGATLDITGSVAWSSDAPTVSIDGTGLADGLAAGTAKVSGKQGTGATAITGTLMLVVTSAKLKSIVLAPEPTVTMAKGTSVQFKATGFFDDQTQQDLTDTATWSSSAPLVASISNDSASNGLAFGVKAGGPANITATVMIGTLTVTSAIAIPVTVTAATLTSIAVTTNPATTTATVPNGAFITLVATGTYTDGTMQVLTGDAVTWTSASATTAKVSNNAGSRGRVTGVALGTVDITATATNATTPPATPGKLAVTVTAAVVATIAVTPLAPAALVKAHTQQFAAEATMTDGTKVDVSATATWTSAMTTVASISNAGLVTGIAMGTSKISAAAGGVTSNLVTLTVTN